MIRARSQVPSEMVSHLRTIFPLFTLLTSHRRHLAKDFQTPYVHTSLLLAFHPPSSGSSFDQNDFPFLPR